MTNAAPDLDTTYDIRRSWAAAGNIKTYGALSAEYAQRTGVTYDPHLTWDHLLGQINQRLARATPPLPALSAVVTVAAEGGGFTEPGGGFWGSASTVPPRPKTDVGRLTKWAEIVRAVHKAAYPAALPR